MLTPEYYKKGPVECFDVIRIMTSEMNGEESFIVGCIIKYLWRYKHKDGIKDLEKAKTYIEELINVNNKTQEENNGDGYDKANDISHKLNTICMLHMKHDATCKDCPLYGTRLYREYGCDYNKIPKYIEEDIAGTIIDAYHRL